MEHIFREKCSITAVTEKLGIRYCENCGYYKNYEETAVMGYFRFRGARKNSYSGVDLKTILAVNN